MFHKSCIVTHTGENLPKISKEHGNSHDRTWGCTWISVDVIYVILS